MPCLTACVFGGRLRNVERSNSETPSPHAGDGVFARKRRERQEQDPEPTSAKREAPQANAPHEPVPAPDELPESAPVVARPTSRPADSGRMGRPVESRVRTKDERMSEVHASVDRARGIASRVVRIVASVAGCCLIAAAVLIAVKANPGNDLVSLVRHLAEFFDLGFFSLSNPIKQFNGSHGQALTALLNYGIGAVVWFVVGGFVAALVNGKNARR